MTVHATYEVLDRPLLATAALRREPLLDPFVCGVREVEQPVVALRVTVREATTGASQALEAAFYPSTGELGVTSAAGRVTWLHGSSVDDAFARWAATLEVATS